MFITRLLHFFCILGFVAALQDLQNSTSTVTTSTTTAMYCQLSGGFVSFVYKAVVGTHIPLQVCLALV